MGLMKHFKHMDCFLAIDCVARENHKINGNDIFVVYNKSGILFKVGLDGPWRCAL